jgi:hypothetical protein
MDNRQPSGVLITGSERLSWPRRYGRPLYGGCPFSGRSSSGSSSFQDRKDTSKRFSALKHAGRDELPQPRSFLRVSSAPRGEC